MLLIPYIRTLYGRWFIGFRYKGSCRVVLNPKPQKQVLDFRLSQNYGSSRFWAPEVLRLQIIWGFRKVIGAVGVRIIKSSIVCG